MAAVTEALAQDKCSLNHLVLQVRPGPRGMDLSRVPLPQSSRKPWPNPGPPSSGLPFRPSSSPPSPLLDLGARVRGAWVCTRTTPVPPRTPPPPAAGAGAGRAAGAAADAGAGAGGHPGAAGAGRAAGGAPAGREEGPAAGLRAAGGAAGAAGGSGSPTPARTDPAAGAGGPREGVMGLPVPNPIRQGRPCLWGGRAHTDLEATLALGRQRRCFLTSGCPTWLIRSRLPGV